MQLLLYVKLYFLINYLNMISTIEIKIEFFIM